MSSLKESLLNTLKGVNADFDAACADLQELVAETDDGVKAADSRLTALLQEVERNTDGVIYELAINCGDESQAVEFYRISPHGYPIANASSTYALHKGYRVGNIGDKYSLEAHFQKMSDERNSPLITAVTYLVRKLQSSNKSL